MPRSEARSPGRGTARARRIDHAQQADPFLHKAETPRFQRTGVLFRWSDSMIAVMDGRHTLGHLLAGRAGSWRAFGSDLRPIGDFDDRETARKAIVDRARKATP